MKIACKRIIVDPLQIILGNGSSLLLPPLNEVAERYCFHRCLSVHSEGHMVGYPFPSPRHLTWDLPTLLASGSIRLASGQYASHWMFPHVVVNVFKLEMT